jgi:toxin ParE1/3/4
MRLEFHPEALAEYRAAALYYESNRVGLGARFADMIEEALRRIVESPATWRIMEDDVRRCLTHVFPYGVLYSVEADFILVLAVSHLARKPGYWKARR